MKNYNFGLEAEFIVFDTENNTPLWHTDLKFENLYRIMSQVEFSDLPSLDGLELEKPHRHLLPFVVEGYHLPNMNDDASDILPKGLEIRTPVCGSLQECMTTFRTLYTRMQAALAPENLALLSLSHHPLHAEFKGPQNKRRHDYWQWAMEVMTTYGPDINVSFPQEIAQRINDEDLIRKINYYGPALSALSVASPLVNNDLWQDRNQLGLSYRMFKRSYIAPPIEIHPHEKGRYEFKVFDMPKNLADFEAQFLSFLVLVLDESLPGRTSHQARIYDLGQVARFGLTAEFVEDRLTEFSRNAEKVLSAEGFNPRPFMNYLDRLKSKRTPAHEIRDIYLHHDRDMAKTLKDLLDEQMKFQWTT